MRSPRPENVTCGRKTVATSAVIEAGGAPWPAAAAGAASATAAERMRAGRSMLLERAHYPEVALLEQAELAGQRLGNLGRPGVLDHGHRLGLGLRRRGLVGRGPGEQLGDAREVLAQ